MKAVSYVLTAMLPVYGGLLLVWLNENKDRTPQRPVPRPVSPCAAKAPPKLDPRWWTRK